MTRHIILAIFAATAALCLSFGAAFASCCGEVSTCDGNCTSISASQTEQTIAHTDQEFINHREWMVKVMFEQHILPAMQLMAEQLTAMAMHQVMVIGAFMDAKHQLETQRIFQQLMAEAHKDYQPSEGMCTFGTATRSLAASERKTEITALALAARGIQRELLSGDGTGGGNGERSDYLSRIAQFRKVYCNRSDNAGQLQEMCPEAPADPARTDNDINYTNMVDAPLTLKLDFTPEGNVDHAANKHSSAVSADEEDLLALMANLFAHKVAPTIGETSLVNDGVVNQQGAISYMDIRAIAAKRSVARNSLVAIASMKSQGKEEAEPYLHAILKEMGVTDEEEILKYLGDRPSYYAQMEVLTKKIYQNPSFYTELYDKPANVDRKTVAMQAIELMQRRDMYRSVLRSEAALSVMLETALGSEEEQKIVNEINRLSEDPSFVTMP